MIIALIVFSHIAAILWLLWRLDKSYKERKDADFGLLAFKDDPVPQPKAKGWDRA